MNTNSTTTMTKTYQSLAELPTVSSATRVGSRVQVMVAQKDTQGDKTRSFAMTYSRADGAEAYECSTPFPYELSDCVGSPLVSSDGQRMIVLRKPKASNGATPGKSVTFESTLKPSTLAPTFEVLDKQRFVFSHKPTCHGRVSHSASSPFGDMSLSADGNLVTYVAEQQRPQCNGYFEEDTKKDTVDKPTKPPGQQNVYEDDWGELLDGVLSLRLFVFDVHKRRTVRVRLSNVEDMSIATPVFTPDGKGIVFVAFFEQPRRLGMYAYNTRPSRLYRVSLEGITDCDGTLEVEASLLSGEDHSPRTPRFSPHGCSLAYLTTAKTWLHHSSSKLRIVDWAGDRSVRTAVDLVPDVTSSDSFPGIWTWDGIPRNAWLDDTHLVLNSQWANRRVALVADISSATPITPLPVPPCHTSDERITSLTMLHASPDSEQQPAVVLLSVSLPSSPSSLWEFTPSSQSWHLVRGAATIPDSDLSNLVANTQCELVDVPREGGVSVQAMLFSPPASTRDTPLILQLHGGPHSAQVTAFSPTLSFMLSLGFRVLQVNYRGSTGYGQSFLEALPGHAGDMDVKDCVAALDQVLSSHDVDPHRVAVIGGSHGGFLTTHLIGQYPDKFRVASTRNPVTNLAASVAHSDIPDWMYVETGHDFSLHSDPGVTLPTAELYADLLRQSPVQHVHRVKTPVLLVLGAKDRRVPVPQTLDYHNWLKARGVPSKLLMYPNLSHPLTGEIANEGDVWVNKMEWITRHMNMLQE